MGKAEEYADARLAHYKALLSNDYGEREGREQRNADLWAAMDPEEQKEAAEAYFSAVNAFDRTRKR